jgi:thymidylate synthase
MTTLKADGLDFFKTLGFQLRNNGKVVSPRGHHTREVLNVSMGVNNPRLMMIDMDDEDCLSFFNCFHLLFIDDNRKRHYQDNWQHYPDFSPMISTVGSNFMERFANCINILKEDLDSRQAYLPIANDTDNPHPCIADLSFHIREGKLRTTVGIRSMDFVNKLKWDMAIYSAVGIMMATALNIEPGPVIFNFTSLHYYLEDAEKFDQMALIADYVEIPDSIFNVQDLTELYENGKMVHDELRVLFDEE